jgi:hypothetical protein
MNTTNDISHGVGVDNISPTNSTNSNEGALPRVASRARRRQRSEARAAKHAIIKNHRYEEAVAELQNPHCCTTATFIVLRFLTFPSTPVAAGTARSSCCCRRVDLTTPIMRDGAGDKNDDDGSSGSSGSSGGLESSVSTSTRPSVVSNVSSNQTVDSRTNSLETTTFHVTYASKLQLIGSRFLIAVFVLDYGAAGVGRIMHMDVLDMAAVLPGVGVVMMDIIMTTLESIAELFGTTMTPFIYHLMYPNDPIESRQLARFAIRVYAFSNMIAFVLYPIISGITWIGCNLTFTMLFLLAALRTLQYSVINQVGDAAVQMAKPHWLRTFAGTSMQIPGFDVGGCYVRTQTTEDTLSAHISFIVFVVAPVVGMLYFGVQDNPIPRLIVATVIAFIVMVLSFVFWYSEAVLTCGVQSEAIDLKPAEAKEIRSSSTSTTDVAVVEDGYDLNHREEEMEEEEDQSCCLKCAKCCGCAGRGGIISFCKLEPFQRSLICLNVIVKVVNEQVTNAITAVVLISLGGTYRTVFLLGSGVLGIVYVLYKIGTEHTRMLTRDRANYMESKNKRLDPEAQKATTGGNGVQHIRQHSFQVRLKRWMFVICLICVCLTVSATLLLSRPGINVDLLALAPSSSSLTSIPSSTISMVNTSTTPSSSMVEKTGSCQRANEESSSSIAQDPTYMIMTVIAIVSILPLYPAIKMFDVEYDAFLMDYERDRPKVVTSMTLWINVLAPVMHLLMLGINTYAMVTTSVEDASGSVQVAVTMIMAISVLIIVVLYYMILDRCCLTDRCSVKSNLLRMDTKIHGVIKKELELKKMNKKKNRSSMETKAKNLNDSEPPLSPSLLPAENLSHNGNRVIRLGQIDKRESTHSSMRTHF